MFSPKEEKKFDAKTVITDQFAPCENGPLHDGCFRIFFLFDISVTFHLIVLTMNEMDSELCKVRNYVILIFRIDSCHLTKKHFLYNDKT